MCHPSPAKILRNVKRITKFIESKKKSQPVLSVLILDHPTSQEALTTCILPSLSILPVVDIIRSEFRPYCPECDKTYKREQVMTFREHCRVMHDWLWCENWHRGEGCEFATTSYDELQEHLVSCDFKLSDLFAAM